MGIIISTLGLLVSAIGLYYSWKVANMSEYGCRQHLDELIQMYHWEEDEEKEKESREERLQFIHEHLRKYPYNMVMNLANDFVVKGMLGPIVVNDTMMNVRANVFIGELSYELAPKYVTVATLKTKKEGK